MSYNYSVIVPYRDKYELFIKAVDSIPDCVDIQIIIVDNSPQSLGKCEIPVKEKANICYVISSPTRGAGGARNEGLKHVEGKYLLFLDADDYFTPDAFCAFDRYLDESYDIIFFKSTSIKLGTGEESNRHKTYVDYIDAFLQNGDENKLRFWFTVPWAKMIRTELVMENSIAFDETIASNDLMFSVKTGYYASKITTSNEIVYVVTEGGANQSIDKNRSKESQFARYMVAVSQYKFMEEVGRKDQRFSLLSYVLRSFKDFGVYEFFRYLRYAREKKVNIFANKF